MNNEVIKMMKRILRSQEKMIKLINRINRLPDAQRKKLESMNLIGPKEDKELEAAIREYEEIKKQFEREIEKQKRG